MADHQPPPPLAYLVTSDSSVLYELEDCETLIGRAESCDIVLMTSKSVSSSHARVIVDVANAKRGVGAKLIDSSLNGTFINDARVHKASHPLRSGDSIRFGYDVEVYRFYFPQHLPKDLAGNNENDNALGKQQHSESSSSGNVPIRGPRLVAAATTAAGMATHDSEQAARRHRRSLSPGGEVRDARSGPSAPPFATDEIPDRIPSRQDLANKQSPVSQAGPRHIARGAEFESKGVAEALVSEPTEEAEESGAAARLRRRRQSAGLGALSDPAGISSIRAPTAPLGTSSPHRGSSNPPMIRVNSPQKHQHSRSKSPPLVSEDIKREIKPRRDGDIRSHISSLPRRLPGEEVPVELAFPSARSRAISQEKEFTRPVHQPLRHEEIVPDHSKNGFTQGVDGATVDDGQFVESKPYFQVNQNENRTEDEQASLESKLVDERASNQHVLDKPRRDDEKSELDVYQVDEGIIRGSEPDSIRNPTQTQTVTRTKEYSTLNKDSLRRRGEEYYSEEMIPPRGFSSEGVRDNHHQHLHTETYTTDADEYKISAPIPTKRLHSDAQPSSEPFQGDAIRSSSRSMIPTSNQMTHSHPNRSDIRDENYQKADYSQPVKTRRESQLTSVSEFPLRQFEQRVREETNVKEQGVINCDTESLANMPRSSTQDLKNLRLANDKYNNEQETREHQQNQRRPSSYNIIGSERTNEHSVEPPAEHSRRLPPQSLQQQQQHLHSGFENDPRHQDRERETNDDKNFPAQTHHTHEEPPRPERNVPTRNNSSNECRLPRDEQIDIPYQRRSHVDEGTGVAMLDDSLEMRPRALNREGVSSVPPTRISSSQRMSDDRLDVNDSQPIASDWRQLALETSSVLRSSENDSRASGGQMTGSEGGQKRTNIVFQEPVTSLRTLVSDVPQRTRDPRPADEKRHYQRENEEILIQQSSVQGHASSTSFPISGQYESSAKLENHDRSAEVVTSGPNSTNAPAFAPPQAHVSRSNHQIPNQTTQETQPVTRASFTTIPHGSSPDAGGSVISVNIVQPPDQHSVPSTSYNATNEPLLQAPGGIAWVVPSHSESSSIVPISAAVPLVASSTSLLYSEEAASGRGSSKQSDPSSAPQPVRLNTALSPSHQRALSLLEDVKSEPLSPLLANKKNLSASGKPMGSAIENLSASLSFSRSLPTSPLPASSNSRSGFLLNHSALSPALLSDPLLAEERSRMREEVTALRSVARELRSMVEAQYMNKGSSEKEQKKTHMKGLSSLLANTDSSGSVLLRRGVSLAFSNLSSILKRATIRSAFQTWQGASNVIGKEQEVMKTRHFDQFRAELQGKIDQQVQEHDREKQTLLLQLEIERLKLAESSNAPQFQMLSESTANEFVPVLDSSVNASMAVEDGAAQTDTDAMTRRRAKRCMSPTRPVWEDPNIDGALASTAASRNRTHASITQRVALEAAAMEEARQSLLRAPLRSKSPAVLAAAMMAQASALNHSAASSGQSDDRHSAPQLLVMPSLRRSVELANAAKGLPPLSVSGGGAAAAASMRGRKSSADSQRIPSRSSSAGRSQTLASTLPTFNVPAPALAPSNTTSTALRSTTPTISSTAAATTLTATAALNQSATISLLQQALNKSSAPPQPPSLLNGQSLLLRVDENGRLVLVPTSSPGIDIPIGGGGGGGGISSSSLQSLLNRGAQTSSSVIKNLLSQPQQQLQGQHNQQYSTQMNEMLSAVLASTGNQDGLQNFSTDVNSIAAQALLITREEQLRRLVGAADEQIIRLAVAAAGNSFSRDNSDTQRAMDDANEEENIPEVSNRIGSTGVRGSFADMSGGGGKIVKSTSSSNSSKPPRVSIHERGPPMGSFQLARSKHAAGAGALYEPDLEKLAARRKTEPLGTSEASSTSLGGSAGLNFPQKRRNAGTVTEEPLLEFAGMLEDREVQRKEAAAQEAAVFDVMDPLGRFREGDNDDRRNSSMHSGLSSAVAGSRRVMHFPEDVELNAFRQPSSSIGDGARDFGGGYATSYAFEASDNARDFGLPGTVDIRQAHNISGMASGSSRVFNLDELHREGRIGALLNDGERPGEDAVEKRALDMFRGSEGAVRRNSSTMLRDPPSLKRVRGGFVGNVVLPLRPGMLSMEISQGVY